jgi:hypothetical protein
MAENKKIYSQPNPVDEAASTELDEMLYARHAEINAKED